MLVLITYHKYTSINYKIYRLNPKKPSLQVMGKISYQNSKIIWELFNSQQQLIETTILDNKNNFNQIVQHPHLNMYNFDIVVHKIQHGGDEYDGISLLNQFTLQKLTKFIPLAPHEQKSDLEFAHTLINQYPNIKHYACYETAFHQTMAPSERMLVPDWHYLKDGIKSYGSYGLSFMSLADKLNSLTDKRIAKGKWILAYLNETDNTLCAIKNKKSVYCTSSSLHHELPSLAHNGRVDPNLIKAIAHYTNTEIDNVIDDLCSKNLLQTNTKIEKVMEKKSKVVALQEDQGFNDLETLLISQSLSAKLTREYYISALAGSILELASILQGIEGIIFSGDAGCSQPKLRQLICDKLEWLGVKLGNKRNLDNYCNLSKKDSKIQIFTLPADPFQAMLNQLFERI